MIGSSTHWRSFASMAKREVLQQDSIRKTCISKRQHNKNKQAFLARSSGAVRIGDCRQTSGNISALMNEWLHASMLLVAWHLGNTAARIIRNTRPQVCLYIYIYVVSTVPSCPLLGVEALGDGLRGLPKLQDKHRGPLNCRGQASRLIEL